MNRITQYYFRYVSFDGNIRSGRAEFMHMQGRPYRYVFIHGYRKDEAEKLIAYWNKSNPEKYHYSLEPFTD